jgi:orotidine-5'-phosphate decarboxylase
MLDPKLHDIKETVLNNFRKFAKYSILSGKTDFFTVHASN